MSSTTSETFIPGETNVDGITGPDPERMETESSKEKETVKTEDSPEPSDSFEVTLEPEDDPKNLTTPRKWAILFVVCVGTLCATSASSMVSFVSTRPSIIILMIICHFRLLSRKGA